MLTPALKRSLRWFIALVMVVISGLWLIGTFKYVAVPFYVVMVLLTFVATRGKQLRAAVVAFAAFLLATLSPIDVNFHNFDGPPRLVPYVSGLPTSETLEKALRGEVVLGGCIVSGLEPRWVLVW